MKKIWLNGILVFLVVFVFGIWINHEPNQIVEARNNSKVVDVVLKPLDAVYFQINQPVGLYYNRISSCIYTFDYIPIAEQTYSAKKNQCTGYYQKYIPK